MPRPAWLADAALVARFELAEALRTRRALSLALLFLLIAYAQAWTYAGLVGMVEEHVREHALLRGAAGPAYDALLLRIAGGDHAVARHLATRPAVALFYVHISLAWVPFLVALTAPEPLARDLATRAARYPLLRTSRLAWAVGKLAGQALLIGLVLLASAALYLGVAAWRIAGFDLAGGAAGIAGYTPLVLAHALAFLALASLASYLASRPAWARGLALLLLAGAALVSAAPTLARWADLPEAFGRLAVLSPYHYTGLAFRPEPAARLLAPVVYLGFAAAFAALGYRLLRARDV